VATARVMLIGDSFVKGNESSTLGYRSFSGRLQESLAAGGYLFDFVGSQLDTPAIGGDAGHEGYAGAFIDSTGHASNNITDKIPTILASGVGVDLIVVLVGWADVLANTSSIGTKYSAMVDDIQAEKPSAKILLCTLPPYWNKTEGETNAAYPAYQTLNAAIRAETGTGVYIVDLAALSSAAGSNAARTVFVEQIIAACKTPSTSLTARGGSFVPAAYGGHLYSSWQALYDAMATWTTTPPNPGGDQGPIDNEGGRLAPASAGPGFPYFTDRVSAMQVWTHVFEHPDNRASNTGVEIRNVFAMTAGVDSTWRTMFAGAQCDGAWWNGTGHLRLLDAARVRLAAAGRRRDALRQGRRQLRHRVLAATDHAAARCGAHEHPAGPTAPRCSA
jgi:hypothetical protein